MKHKDFVIFILTHGRPHNQITYSTLRRLKYSGELYFVIDNEDSTADEYRRLYGDRVIMFDKLAVSRTFDEADNFSNRKAIVYARNICFQLAKDLGFTYFMELDDDYPSFEFRIPQARAEYLYKPVSNINHVLDVMLDYYISTPFHAIAMSQGGDWIGGSYTSIWHRHKRKAMNSFICSVERPFQFVGRINEDVNTYVKKGSVGYLFATIPCLFLQQKPTQQSVGGMTDIYLDNGTYVKSFYTIMMQPSSVKIKLMNTRFARIHHSIVWRNTLPVILREEYRKNG